ncbi:MAG TPA: TetR family transcriptional regulator [Microbacterium sp.]|nr:TetR family transcriptional regulator [Microbacterium sp.]
MSRRVPNDPDRRERILDAALDVIAERGVHATTHRRIAERAEVPLGSLTYYFDGLHDIIAQAFTRMSNRMSALYRSSVALAATREEAERAVVDLICGEEYMPEREMTLLFEMYAYAEHSEPVARLSRDWMVRSRESLMAHFPEDVARVLDVLVEGWPMHRRFEGRPLDRALVARTVRAVIASGG